MAVTSKTKPRKPAEPPVAPATLKQFLHDMLLIRRFEERAGQLYGMGLIGGFCHLYIGQEAVVVGLQAALKEGDTIVTSYRDHGHMLACGMDPKGVMAELAGRRDGYSHGKGGSMHMFSREKNFFGGHGIVGAQVPIGTGLGFAHRYRDDGFISVTFLGDGAINQGQVYESFNMAGLWNPCPALRPDRYGGLRVPEGVPGKGLRNEIPRCLVVGSGPDPSQAGHRSKTVKRRCDDSQPAIDSGSSDRSILDRRPNARDRSTANAQRTSGLSAPVLPQEIHAAATQALFRFSRSRLRTVGHGLAGLSRT